MKANLCGVVGVSLMLGALGCASGHAPTERMTSAKAAVRSAQELGSSSVPKADLHVKLAQEQIEFAHKLIDDGENERAATVLARASADAELALALTKEAQARAAAQRDYEMQKTMTRRQAGAKADVD
jgi:hypothetical protein